MLSKPKPFQWDFDGSCKPGYGHPRHETFSVGVFQWLPKKRGDGLKRGKVIKRFRGYVHNPQPVYDQAERFIAKMASDGLAVREEK